MKHTKIVKVVAFIVDMLISLQERTDGDSVRKITLSSYSEGLPGKVGQSL
jgi:hypothetical protein